MHHLVFALAAFAIAVPAQARTWEHVYPLQRQQSFTIEDEGVIVTVTPPPPYPDRDEVSDEEFQASYEDSAITVQFPGLPLYEVPTDTYRSSPYGIAIGIGRMARSDAAPVVLIAGYTGGMHCCATLQVVSFADGRPESTILPPKDGAPVDTFPKDIDGDGVRDIRWQDGSLLYAFTSYAASWPVPRIYNLRGGQPIDVSREPRYARIYRNLARETLRECRERQGAENAGACAAYAYAMAMQDQAEEGIRTAAALATRPSWSPSQCAAEFDEELCAPRRPYLGFEDELRQMMRQHGYLP